MSNSIKVSEKYGVNPTIPVCFWCGKEKGEIAFLGKLPGDVEAPKSVVLDYEPCDSCKEKLKLGIQVVEAVENSSTNNPPIQDKTKPTGRWLLMSEAYFKRNFEGDELKSILQNRKIFVAPNIFNAWFEGVKKAMEEHQNGEQ